VSHIKDFTRTHFLNITIPYQGMRLFLAITLPKEYAHAISRIPLTPFAGKRVEEENYHINLHFFGEVADEKPIIKTLETISFKAFPLEIKGFSEFPSKQHPRVVFLGVFSPFLLELHKKIVSALHLSEDRPYTPHLTLMRVSKTNTKLAQAFFKTPFHAPFLVSCFSLFKSTLTPQGPRYSVVKHFCAH